MIANRGLVVVLVVLFCLATLTLLGQANGPEPDFLYGYVKEDGIALYLEASLDAPRYPNLDRAAGSTRSVGRTFVMGGAILRTIAINQDWGRVVTDSTWSVYEGNQVFVQYADLELIDPSNFMPLGHLINPLGRKSVVVSITNRQIALFEGEVLVYTGPVVVNPRAPTADDPEGTPRGSWYLSQTSVSRDMPGHVLPSGTVIPGFPGVGWTALLSGPGIDNIGYWFHTSAWFDWASMSDGDVFDLATGGCVSSPSWLIDTPAGIMRADVFFWRWVGGNPQATSTTRHRLPQDQESLVRVYIVDEPEELLTGTIARTILSTGYQPAAIYNGVITTPQWQPVES